VKATTCICVICWLVVSYTPRLLWRQ